MEAQSKAGAAELCVQHLECIENAVGAPVFEWLGQDGIAVVAIEDHNIVVASAGWIGELPFDWCKFVQVVQQWWKTLHGLCDHSCQELLGSNW